MLSVTNYKQRNEIVRDRETGKRERGYFYDSSMAYDVRRKEISTLL